MERDSGRGKRGAMGGGRGNNTIQRNRVGIGTKGDIMKGGKTHNGIDTSP